MSIMGETHEVILGRQKLAQTMSLSGIGHWHPLGEEVCWLKDEDVGECMGHDPLDLLMQELHNALAEVVQMKIHTHQFDENGFCYCGWDGNA